MNRDLVLGIAFFALMGIGGGILVWLNWRKISVDQDRDAQRSRVALLARHVGVARTQLEAAQHATKADRKAELAKQAADAFTAAIGIDARDAIYWSGRAQANLILGDKDAARRDLDKARELEPGGAWADLEKQLTP